MTAALDPNPEATRPELTENGEGGRAPGLLGGRYGTTSLRVGAASIWLSIIVLLPLAAIVWQAAGGGWHAFWARDHLQRGAGVFPCDADDLGSASRW